MVQQRGRFCSFGRWRPSLPVGLPGWSHPAADHVQRVVAPGAAALHLVSGAGTATAAERFTEVTDKLPPDQGRAPHLYDEQLQRQQQEKILMRAREGRTDLLEAAVGPPA